MLRSSTLTPIAALAALAVAGCGGSSSDEKKDTTDSAKLSRAFTTATGIKLQQRDTDAWTTLRPADSSSYRRYGYFTIYLVKQDSARKVLLGERASTFSTTKDYGNDVIVSSTSGTSGDDPDEAGRLDRAVRAAVRGNPALVPAEERPCNAVGIDPASGKEGTCILGDKRLTVVDSGSELTTPALRAKLTSSTTATTLPARTSYTEAKRAKGRYVVVRYAVTNAGTQPINSVRTNLIVGPNTYTESSDSYSLADYSDNLPIQPGATSTLTTAYDIPAEAAQEATRSGQIELPGDVSEGSSFLSDDEAVGRIRLAGAKTLALSGAASSSSSSSSPSGGSSVSSKQEARKAAAEDALKEFYSALHKGNVKYVCKRLTRAAQQHFGGASACSSGHVISAKAKAKAPATNTGLRFTTILTNGQSRALVLVRRQNGGFTDTARLARQGDLWRVQGTRRLSSLS